MMRLFLSFTFCVSAALANFGCTPPRKIFRIGKKSTVTCTEATTSCEVTCPFGVQPGHPTTLKCANKKWNLKAKTSIFCNQAPVTTAGAPGVHTKPLVIATTPSPPPPTTTTKASTTEEVKTKPQPTFNSGPMTKCGPVLRKFNLPAGAIARCTKDTCKVICPHGIPQPKLIKCFSKHNKWKPKPFSKISCIGGTQHKPVPEPISVQSINVGAGSSTGGVSANGFSTDKNTMTKCGDMTKKKGIKLLPGVGFTCTDLGCTYACENGKAPSVLRVECNARSKKLSPKRAKIRCQ